MSLPIWPKYGHCTLLIYQLTLEWVLQPVRMPFYITSLVGHPRPEDERHIQCWHALASYPNWPWVCVPVLGD